MKIIEQSVEAITPTENYLDLLEKVGRTCYKSEDKITNDSAMKFVKAICKSNHLAILEHYNVHFMMTRGDADTFISYIDFLNSHEKQKIFVNPLKYFNWDVISSESAIFTGSLRAFYELFQWLVNIHGCIDICNTMLHLLKTFYPTVFNNIDGETFYSPIESLALDTLLFNDYDLIKASKDKHYPPVPLEKHILHTLKFTTDRGVSHELVRHRNCAFAQESTRYCNYSKDKFGNEITFIKPVEFSTDPYEEDIKSAIWGSTCFNIETSYFEMLGCGATPEQARSVLPNSLKTEIVVTASELEWQHIINLRYYGTTGKPHPQIKDLMEKALPILTELSEGRIK